MSIAEGQQQFAPQDVVGRLLEVQGLKTHSIQANGLLVREEPYGPVARGPGVEDGLADVTPRRSLDEVLGQLGQV